MTEKKATTAPRAAKKGTPAPAKSHRLGRPPTGNSQPSSVRDEKRNERLLEEGGRLLRTVRLDKEANDALTTALSAHGTVRAAIKVALVNLAGLIVESHKKR